jgi:hypothetical protein
LGTTETVLECRAQNEKQSVSFRGWVGEGQWSGSSALVDGLELEGADADEPLNVLVVGDVSAPVTVQVLEGFVKGLAREAVLDQIRVRVPVIAII